VYSRETKQLIQVLQTISNLAAQLTPIWLKSLKPRRKTRKFPTWIYPRFPRKIQKRKKKIWTK